MPLVAAALALPVAASAQSASDPAPGAAPASPCAAAAAATGVEDSFRAFQCAFDAGDYATSLVALERACELHESPECAFNLGLVHNTLYARGAESEHCGLALRYYRRYLSDDPYGEAREDARLASDELQRRCEPEASTTPEPALASPASAGPSGDIIPAPAPGAAMPVPAHEPAARAFELEHERPLASAPSRLLPFALLGAGAASGAAALVAFSAAWRAHADLEQRARASGDPELQVNIDREAHHLRDSRDRSQALTWVFGLGSAALLGAGTTLLLLESGESSLSVGCDGVPGLTYAARF